MKKIITLLITIILITGCSSNEKTETNPNGKSKTYQFFTSQKYKTNQYTLKLKNDKQIITIIKSGNNIYYELKNDSSKQITIEKEKKRYILNSENNTYTVENITKYDDFAEGYLPEELEKLKNQKYKTGTIWEGLSKLTYEKYQYKEGITIYFFKKNKLVKIENQTPLTTNKVKFKKITNKIDKTKFKIPKQYQEITY